MLRTQGPSHCLRDLGQLISWACLQLWQRLTSGFVHAPWMHRNFIFLAAIDFFFDFLMGIWNVLKRPRSECEGKGRVYASKSAAGGALGNALELHHTT
jgi:hypothetical protein